MKMPLFYVREITKDSFVQGSTTSHVRNVILHKELPSPIAKTHYTDAKVHVRKYQEAREEMQPYT